MKLIKEMIDYIHKNYKVDGIALDYLRYSGGGGEDTSRHPKVTAAAKTITDYIKSKSKSYVISAVCKAEDAATKTYYGQDLETWAKYMDYVMPMVYRADYAGSTNTDDNWVDARVKYIVNNFKVDKNKVVVLIQSYYQNLNLRSKTELDGTITRISGSKVRGVGIFREGLINKEWFETYENIINKSNKK